MSIKRRYTVESFEADPKDYINIVKENHAVIIYSIYGEIKVELVDSLIRVSPKIRDFTFSVKDFKRYSGASTRIKNLLTSLK